MKIRVTIIVTWILVAVAIYLTSYSKDIPIILPGLVLLVSRFLIPSISKTFKKISIGSYVILCACVLTTFIAIAFHLEPVAIVVSLAGAVCGYIFFFSIVISDIAMFFKKQNTAEQDAAANP